MIIVQDVQEKQPWNFEFYGHPQKIQYLATGDYTVEGHETSVVIERKKTTGELYNNLLSKYKQFKAECERIQTFDYRFLICEFPMSDFDIFPINSGIPRHIWGKLRKGGDFMKDRLTELLIRNDIEVFFCNNKEEAEEKVLEILDEIIR
jgi:hypothetical protein